MENELEPGDHIVVNRGFYTHHGIYIGIGGVIHYLKDGIVITDLNQFRKGKRIRKKCHLLRKEKSEILLRAYSRLGEEKYNLIFNNCENFVNWCCTGMGLSNQVLVVISYIIQNFITGGIYYVNKC